MRLRQGSVNRANCPWHDCVQELLSATEVTQPLATAMFSFGALVAQPNVAMADETAPCVSIAVPVLPAPPVMEIVCDTVPPGVVTTAADAEVSAAAALVSGVATLAAPVLTGVTLVPTPTVAVEAPLPMAVAATGVAAAAVPKAGLEPEPDRLSAGAVLTCTGSDCAGAAAVVLSGTAPRPPPAELPELGMGGSPHLTLSDCTLFSQ